ncbi:MAG: winged helix-turn-helix transcriptional regulator [Myxococcales bacterium]|nr:winged helix-turn-helix transcriptional regulator [Myxococcales bacterium]
MKTSGPLECPDDTDRPLPEGAVAQELLAELARALGHPARIQILKTLLAKNQCIAGELCEELPLAASTVSQHLKVLKAAGLIKGEVDGPRRCYCVDEKVLKQFKLLVAQL